MWDVQTGREALDIEGDVHFVESVAYSADGNYLVAGGWYFQVSDSTTVETRREMKVWDAHTGHEVLTLGGDRGEVGTVRFSPDGKRLSAAGWGYDRREGGPIWVEVRVWDAHNGEELRTLKLKTD